MQKRLDSWHSERQLGAGPADKLLHPHPTFSLRVTFSKQSLDIRSAEHEVSKMGLLGVLQIKHKKKKHKRKLQNRATVCFHSKKCLWMTQKPAAFAGPNNKILL